MPRKRVTRAEYDKLPQSTRTAFKGWLAGQDLAMQDVSQEHGIAFAADGAQATVHVFVRDEFGLIRLEGDPWDLRPVTVERTVALPVSVRAKLAVHARDDED